MNQLGRRGAEVSMAVVVIGTVGKETMEGLEQIWLNERARKKVAKKMVRKIAKVNRELYSRRFSKKAEKKSVKIKDKHG